MLTKLRLACLSPITDPFCCFQSNVLVFTVTGIDENGAKMWPKGVGQMAGIQLLVEQ